jgi:3-dehydroquinate synthase
VASIFFRGLTWIYVPTTLLAQADSCMGSKTSLNYKSYKNILGTFFPPHVIYISTVFTNTLAGTDFFSGMGEVAKLHAMGGLQTLGFLEERMAGVNNRDLPVVLSLTRSSLDIKWTYMEGDEFDQGKRNMLNYGHCFGHAIETATHYTIPHGQAVVIGMILANNVALDNGFIPNALYDRLNALFFAILKSDYRQLKNIGNDAIIGAMKQDKKRVGSGLPLIMLNEHFEFFKITDLTEQQAADTLDYFRAAFCS